MAQAELSVGIDLLRGKLKRSSEVVTRLKEYRADDGTIIKYGPQEIYFKEKRDYTRQPEIRGVTRTMECAVERSAGSDIGSQAGDDVSEFCAGYSSAGT